MDYYPEFITVRHDIWESVRRRNERLEKVAEAAWDLIQRVSGQEGYSESREALLAALSKADAEVPRPAF